MNQVYTTREKDATCHEARRPPDIPDCDWVKDSALSGERVLYRDRRSRITLVESQTPLDQRRRAYNVALGAESDLCFDGWAKDLFRWERNLLLLLGHSSDQIVALLALERRQCDARACDWDDLSASPESWYWQPISERWIVSAIWTLAAYRREGHATRLINVAAEHLNLPASRFGWNSDISFSEAGVRFVKQHSTGRVICVSPATP